MTIKIRFTGVCAVLLFIAAVSVFGQINAKITATQGQLLAACGTNKVKVVFLCQNAMYFIDFSETSPQIRKMNGVTSAWFPVISADGKWVVYQTGVGWEGPSVDPVKGKVWLRELAVDGTPVKIADTGYVPRFVQNTPVDTPEIVYATSVDCPGLLCYKGGQTVRKKVVGGVPQPAQLVAVGSYYGGLSWDNRFLATGWPGGPNAFMLDLQNASAGPRAVHTMQVKKNVTNADTVVSIGTCNISRSSSRIFTNTMLYYDFGTSVLTSAKCYHPLLGFWKAHAKLFISRYDAGDLRIYDMPADRTLVPEATAQGNGEAIGKEWYYPEWSTHPFFAAAALYIERLWLKSGSWEQTYNVESIYLLNLKDSLYVKLIETNDTSFTAATDFHYPFIWVETPAGFKEDTTWLAKTIWERTAAVNPFRERKRNRPAEALFSDPEITDIAIYSLSGRNIADMYPASGVTLEKVRRMVGPGSYFVGATIRGKPREIFRIINAQ